VEALWYLDTIIEEPWERPVLDVRPGSELNVAGQFKVAREPLNLVANKYKADAVGIFGLPLPRLAWTLVKEVVVDDVAVLVEDLVVPLVYDTAYNLCHY